MADMNSATSSESSSDESESVVDTDDELQNAFANKQMKPGLHFMAPFVRKRVKINNSEGLKARLCDIRLKLEWLERLDVVSEPAVLAPELAARLDEEKDQDALAHNDFQREVLFYRQAQASVLEALPKIHEAGIPTKRPDDYFAQMAKSDQHMQKVREVLIGKQAVMERREKAKKLRELRKYGKQVQQEVAQTRLKEKKETLESLKKFRKGQKNKLDFLDEEGGRSSKKQLPKKQPLKKQNNRNAKNKTKAYKDKKYGYGGQKKKMKYNDAKSSADVLGFSSKIHQPAISGRRKGAAKGNFKGRQKAQRKK